MTNSWKIPNFLRILLVIVLGVTGLFALIGGFIITVIQARYSYLYIQAIIQKSNLDAVLLRIPSWSRIYMVDLAVVAQVLVAFTGFWIVKGVWQAFREPMHHVTLETFPFPRRYRTYYVQLGLWGTVVGFVIGFVNLSGKSDQAPKVLLAALSASLWSTLAAISLAYILCPAIEFAFQKWLVRLDNTNGDPMEALGKQAAATAIALERLTAASSAADISLTLQSVINQVLSLQKELAAAAGHLESANQRISSLESALATARSEITELQWSARDLRKDLDVLDSEKTTLRSQMEDSAKSIGEEVAQLQKGFAAVERGLVVGRQRQRAEIERVIKIGGGLMEKLRRSLQR